MTSVLKASPISATRSDREGMRIVIELKRDANSSRRAQLRCTSTRRCRTAFGAIMLALVDGEPKVLSLHADALPLSGTPEGRDRAAARATTSIRPRRAPIFWKACSSRWITSTRSSRIIRNSPNTAEAKVQLMERFALSDKQAQAILDMRLARLTGLEREQVCRKNMPSWKRPSPICAPCWPTKRWCWAIIREEILAIKAKYADERRTQISVMDGEIDCPKTSFRRTDVVVTLTHFGYVKRIPRTTYRSTEPRRQGDYGHDHARGGLCRAAACHLYAR